jgi:hypothetical protein
VTVYSDHLLLLMIGICEITYDRPLSTFTVLLMIGICQNSIRFSALSLI